MITREVKVYKPSYPYIGEGDKELVVLFAAKNKGIVLISGRNSYDVGTVRDDWKEDIFNVVPELTLISK